MTCPAVDLTGCASLEISCGLYEHERGRDEVSSWPLQAVRFVGRELAAWRKRNPRRAIVCVQSSAGGGAVLLTLHHADAASLRIVPAPACGCAVRT